MSQYFKGIELAKRPVTRSINDGSDSNRLRPLNTDIGTKGDEEGRRNDAIATKGTQLHGANNFDEQRINHERRRKGVLASASYGTDAVFPGET